MVYVGRDGSIHKDQPWGIDKLLGIVYGVVNLIFNFFQTLLPLEDSKSTNNFRSSSGRSSGSPRPPGPPRPGSNIHGLGSGGAPNPPPFCGSCCGR